MRGGNAQDRRRAKRAADRRVAAAIAEFEAKTFTAAEVREIYGLDTAEEAQEFEAITALAATTTEVPEEAPAVEAEELGGDPNPGTRPDRRLKENRRKSHLEDEETLPEEAALAAFEEQVPALHAAAGEDIWAAEGFVDLVTDLNEILTDGHRAVDVSVRLDKALITSPEGYVIAPISIDRDGEIQIAPETAWVTEPVTTTETAAKMRFVLTDFVLTDFADVTLPDELQPSARMPRRNPGPPTPEPVAAPTNGVAWEALFLPEGKLTDDGRAFAPGSVDWRDLPLSLMAMTETSAQGGHDGAQLAGRIDRIWRDGNFIRAAGVFDSGEFGQEISRMVADGVLRGLSVDTAIHEYQVGPRTDFFTEEGDWVEQDPDREQDESDVLDLLFGGEDADTIFVVTKAVIGMATVCPFPAFADANIALTASGSVWSYQHQGGFVVTALPATALTAAAVAEAEAPVDSPPGETDGEREALTAAAAGLAPVHPPAEWFNDPELEEITPLTVTDDGRIFGHAWSWDTCHISFPDSCTLAPHTQADNAYFHLGEIECEGGEIVAVGKITLDTGHAGPRASRAQAVTHYDDTGVVAAHVRCGEDSYGGWISGAINPELSEEKLRILRGASVSGDWRAVRRVDGGGSNLELVALLAVNVPGFPIPRQPKALVASGEDGQEVLALTAAGVVTERQPTDDLAEIAALAADVLQQPCGCDDEIEV